MAFWKDRPTYVTGGTGLVGGWLVKRLLDNGADIVCLQRDWVPHAELYRAGLDRRVKIVRGDVCDFALQERILCEYEIDTVFHLAAQTTVVSANLNPVSTFETNIRGTWTLLEACRRTPCVKQVIVASSDKAYGAQPNLPYTEAQALIGRHPYDVSKSCADLLAQSYWHSHKLPVAVTRCGNFYGGGDLNWNRIVPGTMRSIVRGEPPVIRSDGSYIRDYFYVEDGSAAYMLLAEQLSAREDIGGQAFNFSNEIQMSVRDLVQKILNMAGSSLEPQILGTACNEIRHQYLSAEKARKELGWKPLFGIQEGLARTLGWYQQYFSKTAALKADQTQVIELEHPNLEIRG